MTKLLTSKQLKPSPNGTRHDMSSDMPNLGECSHLEYYGNDDNSSSIMQISVANDPENKINANKVSVSHELTFHKEPTVHEVKPIEKHQHKLCGKLGSAKLSNTDINSVETKELLS